MEWLESSAAGHSQGDYVVIFPTSSIVIWEDPEDNLIEGNVLNQSGERVIYFNSHGEGTRLLHDLFDLARRKVLRADETLADIMNALDSGGRVGRQPPKKHTVDDDDEMPF
ncbi:MAG: hypothetical protein M3P06_24440 [Acidobacteriota bacterium]|nr:hypothetical protein [Acidobacteriota bacterium]